MDVRFATTQEINEWDAKVLANPDGGDVLQTQEFAEMRALGGWKTRYVIAQDIALTILEKPVFGLGKLWYIPKGPGVSSVVQLGNLSPPLRDFAATHGVFVIKVEPELEKTADATTVLQELGLLPAAPIQPNSSTVLIDIAPDTNSILAGLNQKGRHAIRRAERDGVIIKRMETSEQNCREFYNLLTQTAEGSFVIRPYEYFRRFWQSFSGAGIGQLFFAYVNDQIVAGAYGLVFGEKSVYKDGARVRERTVYGASHLLQWHIILWAKERGSLTHNLYGSPPSDRINDESHPTYGVGRFKTSFNKHVTDYIGVYDIVVHARQYNWWVKFGERVTKSLWWRQHHESWY